MSRVLCTDRLFGLRKREQSGKHEFDRLCAELDIEHRLTPPGSPRTNGMVERFNGRIEDVLQSHHFRSGEEPETTLHRYVWLYNQQLPQSALGNKTPCREHSELSGLCTMPPVARLAPRVSFAFLAFQNIGLVGLDKACELAWLLMFRSEKSVPPTECGVDSKSAPLC